MSTNEEFAVFECVDPLRGVAVSVEGLHPGQQVAIKYGDELYTDLSGIIAFGDGGRVKAINLVSKNGVASDAGVDGIYDYRIVVIGAGPKSGWGHVKFTDMTTDSYNLGLYDSSMKDHYVDYNSDKPVITMITWGPGKS